MNNLTTKGQRIFNVFNIIIMLMIALVMVYPLYYSLVASLSDAKMLLRHQGGLLLPLQPINFQGYKLTLNNPNILIGLINTVKYVVSGTLLSLLLTSFGAFVVTRRHFVPRKFIMKLIIFPMFFSGGIIPLYFVITGVNIYDTGWTMILPWAVSSYNLIIMRTFFDGIPDSMEESAILDGANDFQVFAYIILPLSKAVLAVITLYCAVSLWNSWYPALLFIRNRKLYPLQMFLREILIMNEQTASTTASDMVGEVYTRELVKYCTIIISTVPIMVIYPFLQKYFVKGVMIGAIKG